MAKRIMAAVAAMLALATLGASSSAAAQDPAGTMSGTPGANEPSPIEAILQAFELRPLVGLGDRHGLAEGPIFYEQLISDPRFASQVGNVVVEFGTAAHQETIDRYVNGETISYSELRKVWTDTVGWIPAVQGAYFAHFFYQVRRTNAALPPDKRIKVWLGDVCPVYGRQLRAEPCRPASTAPTSEWSGRLRSGLSCRSERPRRSSASSSPASNA